MRAGLEEVWIWGSLLTFSSHPGSESELQIALIALFSEMLYRFPNMVVAQVTRESVQQAIASGITAQQVAPGGLVGGRLRLCCGVQGGCQACEEVTMSCPSEHGSGA